jgi:urea transport system substrate-binding protein
MKNIRYRFGVLLSVTGPYGLPARSMVDGIKVALDQINSDPHLSVELEPVFVDPAGIDSRYYDLGAQLLADGIKQVVGCYTSSSRKEVLPLFENGNALLWFPMHYEGFETAANVVYTGASPNHHVTPLTKFLLERGSKRAFCVGSNYIWAWESNRILTETLIQSGGEVLGERLLPVGDTGESIDNAIDAILQTNPDFVFNTLIGDSAYHFYRRFRVACERLGIDQVTQFPIASCSLNEPELLAIGPAACDGHISSSVYFSSIASEVNRDFVASFERLGLDRTQVCADSETTFAAVRLLAAALHVAGSDHPAAVAKALAKIKLLAPQGEIWIDPRNFHVYATPRIGRSRKDFSFEVLAEAPVPEAPDPYLIKTTPTWEVLAPKLRIAS